MSTFECSHGFEKPTQCLTCMEDGPVAPPRRPTQVEARYFMAAQFDSSCPGCGGRISAGDDIGSTDIGWCCSGCCRSAS